MRRGAWVLIAAVLIAGSSTLVGLTIAAPADAAAPRPDPRSVPGPDPGAELAAAQASLGAPSSIPPAARPSTAPRVAAPDWSAVDNATPAPAGGGSLAYDGATRQYVLFGGENTSNYFSQTWTLSLSSVWTPIGGTAPSARSYAAMTYDAADGYVLLFGGYDRPHVYNDTWKFQKGTWTQLKPAKSPPPLFGASMTYDSKDGYVLLFGGQTSLSAFSWQTWTYKGGAWSQLSPARSPPARGEAPMDYDSHDGYVVLFGGFGNGSTVLGDTWNFTKGAWRQLAPAASPSARGGASLVYSPEDGKLVLFGGYGLQRGTPVYPSDTWTFAAGKWKVAYPAGSPSDRVDAAAADGTATTGALIFGGFGATLIPYFGDLWSFAKGTWNSERPSVPAVRTFQMMAWDGADGYVLLYGGMGINGVLLGDTWKFAKGGWTPLYPKHSPGPREGGSMTYDPTDGYVVLFGGDNGSANLCDTWTFSKGQWNDTGLGCVGSPQPRSYAAMTFDPADGYVLLYGGVNMSFSYTLTDTWAFVNGAWTTWAFRPGMDPGPLVGEEMAYDSADGYVLLFGGENSSGVMLGYTYAWYAGNWTNLTGYVSGAPSGVALGSMAYDTALGEIVLFGGLNGGYTITNVTYTYSGGAWGILSPAHAPPVTLEASLAYDPTLPGALLFGGCTGYACPAGGTWALTG